jgi:predicted phage terminase large subunit-like protein
MTENRMMFPLSVKPEIVERKSKEPNLTACGVDQPATGGHYDHIIADDVVNEKDRDSDTVRRHKRDWFPNIFYLAAGPVWFIGTRWHPQDLYQTIIDKHPKFFVYRQSIYNDDGSTWLADTYTPEYIEERKAYPITFSHQLLNIPMAGEDQVVFLDWFIKETPPARDKFTAISIGVDPAYSERDSKQSCFKAVVVMGRDNQNRVWILDGLLTREGLDVVRNRYLPELVERWKPLYIRVENNAVQKGAELFFADHKEYGNRVKGPADVMVGDKLGRAQGWIAQAATERIYVNEGPWWMEAAYQLEYFPNGDFKDFPDAMSCAWCDVGKVITLTPPLPGVARERLPV